MRLVSEDTTVAGNVKKDSWCYFSVEIGGTHTHTHTHTVSTSGFNSAGKIDQRHLNLFQEKKKCAA